MMKYRICAYPEIKKKLVYFVLPTVLLLSGQVLGDIFLHNPRGCNNRLNENGRARTNAKRLYDSQDNERGGYNVGPQPMYYYTGSQLQIEWTQQHSCGDENSHCNLVLQYMCGDNVRDGTTTNTIPVDKNTDPKYGMHEDYDYYTQCQFRERNKGLFTADQDMRNRNTAVFTRQENNDKNNRYGYECTEERDYYPYWHPSPWKDIAVLTNDARRCKYYQSESANVKSRWACVFTTAQLEQMDSSKVVVPNNRQDCETFRYPDDETGVKGVWKELPAHGLPAPDCREPQHTRDNHLGNTVDGHASRYNWTVPSLEGDKCVFRIRYNVSTNDYDGWNTSAVFNANDKDSPSKLDLSQKYGFINYPVAADRGYVFENDPEVKIFDEGNFNFRLALDTSQFGRTFQDRTHVFSIRKRPAELADVTIHNVNVRGKRGNIVQVYPAVEYDFVPNTLEMAPGHYVHFQWTGSDTNPNNNAGQGKAGSDRNNALQLRDKNYPEGTGVQYGAAPTYGHYGNNYPMLLMNESQFLGLSEKDLLKLAFTEPDNVDIDPDLNEASPHFDLGARKVSQLGTYHYVSTRNNDFTNRDQKARIIVSPMTYIEAPLGWLGGNVVLPNSLGTLHADEGVLDRLYITRLEVWPTAQGEQKVKAAGTELTAGEEYVSDFLVVYPESRLTVDGKSLSISIKVDGDASNIAVYRSSSESHFSTWTKLDTDVDGDVARFQATSGGVYVAKSHSYTVLIVALVIAGIAAILLVAGVIFYFKRNPAKWKTLKSETVNLTCNFKNEI